MLALIALLLFSFSQSATSSPTRCGSFALRGSAVNAIVTNTTFYRANDTVAITNPFSSIDVNNLPAFCRVELSITTNTTANSTAHADVWLPESWNGRFLGFGNGGFGGGGTSDRPIYLVASFTQLCPVNVADLGFVAVTEGCKMLSQALRYGNVN